MGWRASDTRELHFEDACSCPRTSCSGARKGEGFINFMKTLDAGRIGVAALSLGLAEGALETAVALHQREGAVRAAKVFEFQQVQFRLADLATEIEAGRHLTYHAAWLKDQGASLIRQGGRDGEATSARSSSMKRHVGRHPGDGRRRATRVSTRSRRMMRDAKICEIGEGTNEIQRMVIARQLTGGDGRPNR